MEWGLVGITIFWLLNYLNFVRDYNIVIRNKTVCLYTHTHAHTHIYIKHNLKRGKREHKEINFKSSSKRAKAT